MKAIFAVITIVVLILVGVILWLVNPFSSNSQNNSIVQMMDNKSTSASSNSETEGTTKTFSTPKKSAHYETNTPEHGATLAGAPLNVVIDFNFDLAKPSEIKIVKDGKDYGVGETLIDNNKLSMRRNLDPDAPDGLYRVEYNACWPDGSCHDGYFQFAIDRKLGEKFEDQSEKSEVTIKMSQIKFMPMDLKIKKGTKVTWVNDESIEHYVNTDSHPAHTYYPTQNSKALKKGEQYSVTFDQSGIYPYHCSAHASNMTGNILVL